MKFSKYFIFLILFLSSFRLYAQTTKTDSLSILFIGNSFTHMNDMPSIFSKLAVAKGKTVHVEKNTQAGASFHVHTSRLDMFEKIKSRKWDYIVLQAFSREFCHPKEYIDTASIPYFSQILDTIKTNHSCTNLLLYNTWAYKNGFAEREEINTFEKMQDSIICGYRYVAEKFSIPIVPVGMVWKYVRETNPNLNLYVEDEAHPNKLGSYLSACTFFASIFDESPEGALTSTITTENALIIQKAAASIVLPNYKLYNLDVNTSSVKYFRSKGVEYITECKSNYPNATKITWDFGNGKTSNDPNVIYAYPKAGKYTIKLTVEDLCGTRIIYKKVVFAAPKKPKKPSKSIPVKDSKSKKKI